jgi:glucose-6-phosphate-specific signal transduction histidine kinase
MDVDGYAGPEKKNYDSQLTIYRVIQDVLKRIFKHSKGELVKLKLQFQVNQILLEIYTDDPRFNTSVVSTDLYMVNLANRCDHFGGSFTFEKVAGSGIYFRAAVSA